MSTLVKIVGAIAVVVVSFFVTLFVLDYVGFRASPDQMRARNAKQIMAALERYREAKGTYPVTASDVVVSELRKPLLEGNFIATFPTDPPDAEATRYVSADGKSFGLRVIQDRLACLIEVRGSRSGWWGQPSPCQF